MKSLEQEMFSDPNDDSKPALAASDPRMLKCLECSQTWRQQDIRYKPRACPFCRSEDWQVSSVFLQICAHKRDVLLKAARDVLIGNDFCCFGRTKEGTFVALSPYLARRWRIAPELYGTLLDQECTRADVEAVITGLTMHKIQENQPIGSAAA
jgi:hypothetical protein